MPLTADTMRAILLICLLGMALVAALYLRRRRLSFREYIGWGLLIILVPLLGPFLVLLAAPGKSPSRP